MASFELDEFWVPASQVDFACHVELSLLLNCYLSSFSLPGILHSIDLGLRGDDSSVIPGVLALNSLSFILVSAILTALYLSASRGQCTFCVCPLTGWLRPWATHLSVARSFRIFFEPPRDLFLRFMPRKCRLWDGHGALRRGRPQCAAAAPGCGRGVARWGRAGVRPRAAPARRGGRRWAPAVPQTSFSWQEVRNEVAAPSASMARPAGPPPPDLCANRGGASARLRGRGRERILLPRAAAERKRNACSGRRGEP